MPSRRAALRGALAAGSLAVTGCLGRATAPFSGLDATRSSDATAQFQYDARNTGASASRAPDAALPAWHRRLDPVDGGLVVGGGRVVVAAGDALYALAATDGRVVGSVEPGPGHDIAAPPALDGDTAYVPTWNGPAGAPRGVVAVDLADGSQQWSAIPDLDVGSPVTLADGTVYVGGALESRHVVALDAADGDERWRFRAGEYVSAPAVADGTVYVGGGEMPVVYAIDPSDGSERWRTMVDSPVWAAPTVVGDTVYVGTRDGAVYALAVADGTVRWGEPVRTGVDASPAVADGTLYVPCRRSVCAISTGGERLWSVPARSPFAPTVADDAVVVTDAAAAFCLDAATGAVRWRHGVPDRPISDAVFTGIECAPVVHDGSVYVASHGGDVYALSAL